MPEPRPPFPSAAGPIGSGLGPDTSTRNNITRLSPTRKRPLLGLTLLAVEDSRFASDALRLMSLASGARLRRADCLASARRHLAVYRPSALVVDMGLPDGSGAELLEELSAKPGRPALVAISGDPDLRKAAEEAGCDVFMEKPLEGLGAFQNAVMGALPIGEKPRVLPSLAEDEDNALHPDPLALRDDLSAMERLLASNSRPEDLAYAAQFLRSVALSARDRELAKGTIALSRALEGKASGATTAARWVAKLLRARLYDQAQSAFGA